MSHWSISNWQDRGKCFQLGLEIWTGKVSQAHNRLGPSTQKLDLSVYLIFYYYYFGRNEFCLLTKQCNFEKKEGRVSQNSGIFQNGTVKNLSGILKIFKDFLFKWFLFLFLGIFIFQNLLCPVHFELFVLWHNTDRPF